jgi:1,4-alpha-glucan branching enzyme
VLTFLRRGEGEGEVVLVALNFTPVTRQHYRIGVPLPGRWKEIYNSDARELGGSGQGNLGGVETRPIPWNGRRHSISVTLPPLGAVFFKPER